MNFGRKVLDIEGVKENGEKKVFFLYIYGFLFFDDCRKIVFDQM